MSLAQYKQKRNLKKSGEPKTKTKNSINNKLIFVVHSHFAKQHHYDLRLQINNVLKSWAVPKSPPLDKNTKRLAIQVEDHPLSYANFQGIIPEGNYGAGKVKIWDKGTYEAEKFSDKEIIFNLHGKKLKGKYVLIKTNFGKNKKSWLWFKGKN